MHHAFAEYLTTIRIKIHLRANKHYVYLSHEENWFVLIVKTTEAQNKVRGIWFYILALQTNSVII